MVKNTITPDLGKSDDTKVEEVIWDDEKSTPGEMPPPSKKKINKSVSSKQKPISLDAQARTYVDNLNKYFIQQRIEQGKWADNTRGEGLFQTVVALDSLWTQSKIINTPVGYDPDLLTMDVEYILAFLDGKSVEESFPYHTMEGKGCPSPEVAAVVIRALIGTRQRLKKNGSWGAGHIRDKFEEVCDRALDFLDRSVDKDNKGWGFLYDGASRLYPTCIVVSALSITKDDPDLFKEHKINKLVPELIRGGKQYIEKCCNGERYTHREDGDAMDLYSANALLALEAVHQYFPERINFKTEIGAVFDYYRSRELPPDQEQQPGAFTEDLSIIQGDEQPDLAYRDNSSRWPWLNAISVWTKRHPQFYEDEWQTAANHLLRFQINLKPTETIYIWSRASQALNTFRHCAAKHYRVTDYDLRKSMYELFTNESMAQQAYDFIRKKVLETDARRLIDE